MSDEVFMDPITFRVHNDEPGKVEFLNIEHDGLHAQRGLSFLAHRGVEASHPLGPWQGSVNVKFTPDQVCKLKAWLATICEDDREMREVSHEA